MPKPRPDSRLRAAWLLAPVLGGLVAYFGVHEFGFVFDDDNAIVQNVPLRAGDWWTAAFGDYQSLSNRPLSCFSLALDLRLGLGPGGMHVVSLAIHLLSAVLVALIVRRLSGGSALAGGLTATVWAVHPLGVDAVAYLTQRSMLLMGCFALLAFWSLLRARGSERPRRWEVLCVAAAALAMASKEEAAGVPIVLVLADRAFGASSWRAMRPRLPFYVALASTWIVLIACVGLGPTNPTVGYATVPPATAWEWLLTQTQCLSHYVRAAFLPNDLRGMYDLAVLREVGPAIGPGLLLVAALAATVWALVRRPAAGFAGAVFFLLLAPTSSVFPIITELCADRRMYLPLLAFVVPLGLLLHRSVGERWLAVVAAVVIVAATAQTRSVAAHYRDDAAFFGHAAASNELTNKSFLSGRILAAQARLERERGNVAEAYRLIERAMQCEAPGRAERLAEANMRQEQGRIDEAERGFRAILRDYPGYAEAMSNLGGLLRSRALDLPEAAAMPLLAEAEGLLKRAVELAPLQPEVRNTYGVLLHTVGRTGESLRHLQKAVELAPEFTEARRNLGVAHLVLGDAKTALEVWAPLLEQTPEDPLLQQLVREARARL